MTAEPATPAATRCAICGEPTLSGQSAHGQCGGYLPDNEREWPWACCHHIEKLLKQRPKTVEQLRHRLRSEYQGDVFDMAVELLASAGKLTRQGELLKLAPARRVLRRPARDDGSADGLFELPQRVPRR